MKISYASSACSLDSGTTFFGPNALIMDGRTLSSAMHARGINMRYLGRIAQILLEREKSAESESKIVVLNQNQSTSNSAPTSPSILELPHFMTTIAMMELIARAAKHVFNPYIQVNFVLKSS